MVIYLHHLNPSLLHLSSPPVLSNFGSCQLVLPVLSQNESVSPVQLILPKLSRNCCSPSKQNNQYCCSNPCQIHLESPK